MAAVRRGSDAGIIVALVICLVAAVVGIALAVWFYQQTSIAKQAIKRKTGARGLRSIMEAILLDTMYDLPGLEGVEEVVISAEVVDGDDARPLYIYSERQKEEAGAEA